MQMLIPKSSRSQPGQQAVLYIMQDYIKIKKTSVKEDII